MTNGFVIDSDILIDHLRGFETAENTIIKVRNKEVIGYISSVTEAELFAGEDVKLEKRKQELNEIINLFTKIILNNEIAQKAGEFRRNYGVEIPDAIIAATAFYQKCKVLTKNKKDFEKIKEIEIENPY